MLKVIQVLLDLLQSHPSVSLVSDKVQILLLKAATMTGLNCSWLYQSELFPLYAFPRSLKCFQHTGAKELLQMS